MVELFHFARPFLHALPPEAAHNLALSALKSGWVAAQRGQNFASLGVRAFGIDFANPVGLAAGFDKNAVAIDALIAQGFGFVEVGTVTPQPQPGNPKPRMFRLPEDQAVINRLGFNNDGLEIFVRNLAACGSGIVGANIGKNKDTEDAVSDYIIGLKAVYPHAHYITINISSPNTHGLRALQARESLSVLLSELDKERQSLAQKLKRKVPLLLKVAPDLGPGERSDIAELVLAYAIDGLIVSNTTITRPGLQSRFSKEMGGLSGKPLFALSTSVLKNFYQLTQGKIPLVGVGGITSAEDAYQKIRAGATLVQLYSALAYKGFGLVREINEGLAERLARDGIKNIRDLVGLGAR